MTIEHDNLVWKMETITWSVYTLDELIKINTLLKEISIAKTTNGEEIK